jgi:hypothetical protein
MEGLEAQRGYLAIEVTKCRGKARTKYPVTGKDVIYFWKRHSLWAASLGGFEVADRGPEQCVAV